MIPQAALLEVMSRKFAAIADDMALTLKRTSRSPFVKEAADFGVGVADVHGRIFAWPSDSTVSGVSSIFYPIEGVLARFDDLAPGDVIGTNDAYTSGGLATHLSDLHLVRPFFHDGRVVAYGWCFCHLSDVGGRSPGSVSPTNAEIFQEGIRLPPVKIVRGGKVNEDVMTIFKANVRTPELNIGDFQAQLAALQMGAKRAEKVIAQHGVETFLNAQLAVQDYSESKARDVLRTIPDGTYEFWDYVDDDLVTANPIRIRLRATFEDGKVELDVSGTDPQVGAALNYPSEGKLRSGFTRRLVTFVCTHDKTIPFNSGLFRPFSVVIPSGVVLRAEFPDPISCRVDTTRRFNDVVNGVLLQAAPDHMAAPAGGASVTLVLSEPDTQGDGPPVVNVVQSLRGGMGAFKGADGVDARDVSYINMKNQRLETIETMCALRVLRYDVHADSGGPGCWRGGVGQLFSIEVLKDGSTLVIQGSDRLRFVGWGVFGGKPAAPFSIIVECKGGAREHLCKVDRLTVDAGDVVTVLMPGGSGYGDPYVRDVEAVASDVRRGFVSLEGAARDYGVAIVDGAVDEARTTALRNRNKRNEVPVFDFGLEREIWESVFDDQAMLALNARLYDLPKAMRQPVRQRIFARVAPALSKPGEGSVADAFGDLAEARARLSDAIGDGFEDHLGAVNRQMG